jgi:hypothetical protein
MKPEYAEKIEAIRKGNARCISNEPMTDEEIKQDIIFHKNAIKELGQTKDTKILHALLDLYVEEKKLCLSGSPREIFYAIRNNYSPKQVIEAFYDDGRFDIMYEEDDDLDELCNDMFCGYWPGESGKSYLPEFCEMFNKVRPKHAEDFLKAFEEVYGKFPKEKAMIETLREDMRKWGRNEGSEKTEKAEEMAKDEQ